MFLLVAFSLFILLLLVISYLTRPGNGKGVLYLSIIPLALVGGLLYAASRKKRAAANVSYNFGLPTGIQFDLSSMSVKGKMKVVFDNASPQSFRFNALYLKLMQGNTNVGNLASGPFTLAAAARTEVNADFRIGFLALGANLLTVVQTRTLKAVQVDGFINSGGFNLYVKKELPELQLPELPSWVKGIKVLA